MIVCRSDTPLRVCYPPLPCCLSTPCSLTSPVSVTTVKRGGRGDVSLSVVRQGWGVDKQACSCLSNFVPSRVKGTLPGTPPVIPFEKYITIRLRHQEKKNELDKIPILFNREENRNILITIPVWLRDGRTDTATSATSRSRHTRSKTVHNCFWVYGTCSGDGGIDQRENTKQTKL